MSLGITGLLAFLNLGLQGRGERPPAAKNLFEKRFLELQKLSKTLINIIFLKVLEGGLGGTSFKKFLPAAPL
jgi:hypothetical protein